MANLERGRPGMAALLAVPIAILALTRDAGAQLVPVDAPPQAFGEGSFANGLLGGLNKPRVEMQGDWGEVVMASARWVVLQNARGQQFPVGFDRIRQFVVRWPTRLDIIAADAFLEVTGVDVGSNQIRTDHIDVYEGNSRTLVTPTMLRLFGANRVITPLDVEQMQIYGAVIPFAPAEAGIPPRIHVVGNLVGADPVRIAAPGNNFIAVLPSPDGLDMTQVTLGMPAYVKKGDMVYYTPEAADTNSLRISRFILYKKMPFRGFVE